MSDVEHVDHMLGCVIQWKLCKRPHLFCLLTKSLRPKTKWTRFKLKGDAENPIHNTLSKLLQPVAQHTRDQQVSAYNHIFITIIQSLGCKEIHVGLLYAEKIAEVVLLNVLWIGFSASTLKEYFTILLSWTSQNDKDAFLFVC